MEQSTLWRCKNAHVFKTDSKAFEVEALLHPFILLNFYRNVFNIKTHTDVELNLFSFLAALSLNDFLLRC